MTLNFTHLLFLTFKITVVVLDQDSWLAKIPNRGSKLLSFFPKPQDDNKDADSSSDVSIKKSNKKITQNNAINDNQSECSFDSSSTVCSVSLTNDSMDDLNEPLKK